MNVLQRLTGPVRSVLLCGLLTSLVGLAWSAPPPLVAPTVMPAESSSEPLSTDKTLLLKASTFRDSMTNTASELVMTAMGFLGVPYKRGGTNAAVGFDCSGFVRTMYEQTVGLVLPRRAEEQARATNAIAKDELRPGDLVFFNTMRRAFSHVGIYVGDGKFIHSPRTGGRVRVEDMRESYWTKRFNGARRVEGDSGTLSGSVGAAISSHLETFQKP
jgi:cell wall-associated NlpC family hydrolase